MANLLAKVSSLIFIIVLAQVFHPSLADTGFASFYQSPYLPNACYGSDPSQIPSDGMFAAAGEEIWEGGAACGREYLVSCVSAAVPGSCFPGEIIGVKIVDRAQTSVSKANASNVGVSPKMVLSESAFSKIANASSVNLVIVDYKQ